MIRGVQVHCVILFWFPAWLAIGARNCLLYEFYINACPPGGNYPFSIKEILFYSSEKKENTTLLALTYRKEQPGIPVAGCREGGFKECQKSTRLENILESYSAQYRRRTKQCERPGGRK